jgi:hypothetical protein
MWMYLGPSSPDHPFSAKVDGKEVEKQSGQFLGLIVMSH